MSYNLSSMNISENTKTGMIRSYGIAFFGCLFLTGINAILDINNPYEQNTLAYIIGLHFISAIVYAIPASFLVFYVIRNQNYKKRLHNLFQIVLYISSTIIGWFMGGLIAATFILDEYVGLDDLFPYAVASTLGAILLPLTVFLIRKTVNNYSSHK